MKRYIGEHGVVKVWASHAFTVAIQRGHLPDALNIEAHQPSHKEFRMISDTRRNDSCVAPARYRIHAAQAQQPPRRSPTCRRCHTPVVDDSGFYECLTCGDADLVVAGEG